MQTVMRDGTPKAGKEEMHGDEQNYEKYVW